MRRKIVITLLIINTVLIIFSLLPVSDLVFIYNYVFRSESDGPSTILLLSSFYWPLIVMIALEILLVGFLFFFRSNNDKT
ncbi:MAG: hypothetical protein PHU00_10145 [Bacteroidales bacterium]|nr:hypothetical protein [Bacteroidales bacterium]